jgi:hypothetical protein
MLMLKKMACQFLGSRFFFKFLLRQQQHSPSHIYYVNVNPVEISHISLIPEDSPCLSGSEAIYGSFMGFFDLVKMPFKKNSMYHTVEQLLRGEKWYLTTHFKKLKKNQGENKAILQIEKLERLISILSEEGYKSQYELGRVDITKKIYQWTVPLHEMIIVMDRDGKLFRIKGGKHRLAIAQHIGISEMPAILTLYHQDAIAMLPEKRRKITGDSNDFRPLQAFYYEIDSKWKTNPYSISILLPNEITAFV